MSNQSVSHKILRAYSEKSVRPGKKDPSKKHGFQTIGIVKGEGRVEEGQMYFNPEEGEWFLPPGDYEVHATGLYFDRDGRLQLGREFVPVKTKAVA